MNKMGIGRFCHQKQGGRLVDTVSCGSHQLDKSWLVCCILAICDFGSIKLNVLMVEERQDCEGER